MINMEIWFAVIVFAVIYYFVDQKKRTRILRENPSREEYDDATIYQKFFSDSGMPEAEVISLWHEIADALNVPAGKLRLSDEFGKDVGSGIITSEELDQLFILGSQRAKLLNRSINFQEIRTVQDYIKALTK